MKEVTLIMKFSLPVKVEKLFNFVADFNNMPLYEGCFLVPGISYVKSSDVVRKVGTLDSVTNTDGSSHDARTVIFDRNLRYSLYLDNFKLTGIKSKLATPIVAFKEDWLYTDQGNSTAIERSITVVYKDGLFNDLFVKLFLYPQLYISFLNHHMKVDAAIAQ